MYIIIGASGYLGSYIIQKILTNTNEKIIATYNSYSEKLENNPRVLWKQLNILDRSNIDFFCKQTLNSNIKYKCVYLSAYHHPDKVESNPELAWQINIACLDYFLEKTKPYLLSLYYASTDSIYGESQNNHFFKEIDAYNPVNTYGRTKAAAEQIVLMHGFSVVRYSLLMGPSLLSKKHFFDIIVESLKNKKDIDMFADSSRSVISFDMASYFTVLLLEKYYKARDIINITSDSYLTKFEMAHKIANKLKLDNSFIKPASIKTKNDFGSKRAQNTLISNKKLKNILKLDNITYNYV
ncbi:MAG: sugar nucleotide-binding protein [Rickettsiales bacterium]|nr:sugar nucleotide-binding protein [Rickettsiales bacterium]